MADELDQADILIERTIDSGVNAARKAAANIPVGEPGECDECGYHFSRLVGGMCGRCRDELRVY